MKFHGSRYFFSKNPTFKYFYLQHFFGGNDVSVPVTSIDRLHLRSAVELMRKVSERYAPNSWKIRQFNQVRDEFIELREAFEDGNDSETLKEVADVIIAATRLGTMLSPDFPKVLADKLEELNGREVLP